MRSLSNFREAWMETRTSRLELGRHFFRRFFDSEFVSTPGQMRVVAGGAIAVLLSSGILLTVAYYHKYLGLNGLDDPAPFRLAVTADALFLMTLSMTLIGLMTTMQWTSLFPTLRDYLALAALPSRPGDLFIAKFTALSLFACGVVVATVGLPSLLLPILEDGRHATDGILHILGLFAGAFAAGLFVFFSLVAVQGVLLNLLPTRYFHRVSLFIQGGLLITLLCSLPLVFSVPNLYPEMDRRPGWAMQAPPFWFLGIHQVITGNKEPFATALARLGIAGPAGAALAAVVTYLWSYRRHRVRVLESESSAKESSEQGWLANLADRFVPDPRELAVFSFIAKTLARSGQHRLVLSAFAALAIALIFEGFVSLAMTRGWRSLSGSSPAFRQAVISAPLALSLFVLSGFRYLFRLPVELPANWVFRLNEPGNRPAFLEAVERFLIYCAVLPVGLGTLPLEMILLGPVDGLSVELLCTLTALVLVESLLFRFDKIPFTSTYFPGKRPVIETLVLYSAAVILYVTFLSAIIGKAVQLPWFVVALSTGLALVVWRLRSARRGEWKIGRLEFEELPEPAVLTLAIDRD